MEWPDLTDLLKTAAGSRVYQHEPRAILQPPSPTEPAHEP